MNKIILIIITIISLNSYSQTLKEKYNEQTKISTQSTRKEVIVIQNEKQQEEPPKKARLERLRDKK